MEGVLWTPQNNKKHYTKDQGEIQCLITCLAGIIPYTINKEIAIPPLLDIL